MARLYKCDVCSNQFEINPRREGGYGGVEGYSIPYVKMEPTEDNPAWLVDFTKADVCFQCLLKMAISIRRDEKKTTRKPRQKKDDAEKHNSE